MPAITCRIVGALLIALGIWGFTAQGPFLVFAPNPVHHIFQVIAGAAALWAGWSDELTARRFGLGAAAFFGVVAVLGFTDVPAVVDFLGLRMSDHWLHLLIGGVSLAAAAGSRSARESRRAAHEVRDVSGVQGI